MANREKKITLGRKQGTASPLPITIKEEVLDPEDLPQTETSAPAVEPAAKTAPVRTPRKPAGLKKAPAKVLKRPFKLSLKAKSKVKPKLGKILVAKSKNASIKKTLLKNGVVKPKVIRKKPQSKPTADEDKPPVLEPIYSDNNKAAIKRKVLKKSDPGYCSITETIESIINQCRSHKKKPKIVKKKETSSIDKITESIEDVVRDLQNLIKVEDIKQEVEDTPEEKPKPQKSRKSKIDTKKMKKENIENELSKIDTSNSNVIEMLDLNVSKVRSKMVENRRHSIEKFPITNQDVKIQNVSLFTTLPRSISPKNKRRINLRQSLDSKRASPYTTRSDSPVRILRNGKQRKLKHLNLLDGLETEYRKRKRLCSDYSGSEISVSKLSGYESDSSFSDLASLHSGDMIDTDSISKDALLKKELLETLENNPPDNASDVNELVKIKRSLSLESKEIENKIDTNSNLCEETHDNELEEDIFMEAISPSFKVPEKSIILSSMKLMFNETLIDDQDRDSEKRKTRSSVKRNSKGLDEEPSTSTEHNDNDAPPVLKPEIPTQESTAESIESNVLTEISNNVDENPPDIIPEAKCKSDKENGDDVDESKEEVEVKETPESLAIKHQILQALGLQSLQQAEESRMRKQVPKQENYTGTLKTVIKLNRMDKKKGRNSLKLTLSKKGKSKEDDDVKVEEDEYKIMKEGSSSTWKAHQGSQSQSSDTAGALRKSHYSNRSNMDGSSEHTSDGDTNANDEGAGKVLVIPEKASSFSIHPDRLCKDECSYCFGKFGLFDTPCHIAQMKSVERQNKILAVEKHLTRDSCLCDACYRHIDRKSNTPSYNSNKSIKRNSLVAPGPRQNHCHVLGCGLIATNILRRKWLIKMRKSVCQVINIDLDNPGLHSIPICEGHYSSLEHLMVCAMCKRKLARNHIHYLGPESNDLNTALNEMGVPVKLNDKPVVCKLCRYFATLVLKNPEDRNDSSVHFYLEYKKRLLHFHDVEVMDEAEAEEPIPAPMKEKEPTKKKKKKNLDPPVLEPQVYVSEEQKRRVPSMDSSPESPSDLLIDCNALIPSIAMDCGNDVELTRREISKKSAVSIKRITKTESVKDVVEKSKRLKNRSDIAVQRLGSNPSISVRQLFPGEEDLPLNGNIEFHNVKERTPEGWEKCTATIQYDPDVKMLWNELQKPYGNQSSFLRHLILLEKYFRNGDLVLSPNATHHSVNYAESVQNRLRAYDNIPTAMPVQAPPLPVKPQKSVSGIITSPKEAEETVTVNIPVPPPPKPTVQPPPVPPSISISTVPKSPPPAPPPPPAISHPPPPPQVISNSFLVPNPAAMVGATVTVNSTPVPIPSTTTSSTIPTNNIPIKPKPPGLISLQPGTKIPVTPLVRPPQSQKIKFPITKNWRPNLIPIDPSKKPEKKPGLVQVISGGKPYHITLEDYKKMCAIKRTFDLRQKRLLEAQRNPSNSLLKGMQTRKGLSISKTSTIVSPTKMDSNSDQEIENSLEKLDKTVEKLEAKFNESNKPLMNMPKIPKSLTVIPQTVTKKTSRPSSPTPLLITKNKPAGKS